MLNSGKLKELEPETFFTLVHVGSEAMQKDSQALVMYGKRTNRFLLVNYGFCL